MEILLTPQTLKSLLLLLDSTSRLPGVGVELGVYQGGALKAMAESQSWRSFFGFDTFSGHPEKSWLRTDVHKPGEFADTSLETVSAAMPPNVELVAGLFPDSARDFAEQIAFAHVDFDLERSTEDAIEWLIPRMVRGGVVVFDDFRWKNCPGVERAIERAGLMTQRSAPHQVFWIAGA